MAHMWEVQWWDGEKSRYQEYDDKDEAVAFAESQQHCRMITWWIEPNLPRRKPDFVYRSTGMDVWEDGKWRMVDIHGGV